MKILIISDIHGSLEPMKKIMEIESKENFDKLIILGDILGQRHWMNPEEMIPVSKLLNSLSHKVIAVQGNVDTYSHQLLLDFDISEELKIIDIDNKKWYLTHGHLNYFFSELEESSILLNGHTHRPELSTTYINPGSISIPRGENPASYIIYEDKMFKLYNLNDNALIEQLEII